MKTLLLAGCGGTGIEILKLLGRLPYKVTLIDKDIIELSNLNRLFPFSYRDIGKYKAQVLGLKYNVEYIVGDILSLTTLEYDVVLVAVDNLQCRIHLNYIYKMQPMGILIDCGVNRDMCHVFSISKDSYCIYCMREMYEIEKDVGGISCGDSSNHEGSNIRPSVCYINSICASLVILILKDRKYNYYIYSVEGPYLNRLKLKRDRFCILCNKTD